VVDGTPQIHPLTGDPHHHLVEVPAKPDPVDRASLDDRHRRSSFMRPLRAVRR
jgi:hypothetical protein